MMTDPRLTDPRLLWLTVPRATNTLAADIVLAARSTLPVLVTAPSHRVAEIVHGIAARGPAGSRRIIVWDAATHADVAGELAKCAADVTSDARLIWLANVERLDAEQQRRVLAFLNERSRAGSTAPHIVASSTVDLYDLVDAGMFDRELFYRLNTVHVVADDSSHRLGPSV